MGHPIRQPSQCMGACGNTTSRVYQNLECSRIQVVDGALEKSVKPD